MIIELVKGSGSGKTQLAAFDRALYEAGIANYNLIPLSSVIPPQTELKRIEKRQNRDKEYGHKLYVVIAEMFASSKGEEAWSGLGWVNHVDNSGKGLFVEHTGRSEEEVIKQIEDSLNSMAEYREEERGKIFWETSGIVCKDEPVCSIVAAVYKSEGWD
jgi:arginine decarboxylase